MDDDDVVVRAAGSLVPGSACRRRIQKRVVLNVRRFDISI